MDHNDSHIIPFWCRTWKYKAFGSQNIGTTIKNLMNGNLIQLKNGGLGRVHNNSHRSNYSARQTKVISFEFAPLRTEFQSVILDLSRILQSFTQFLVLHWNNIHIKIQTNKFWRSCVIFAFYLFLFCRQLKGFESVCHNIYECL